MAMLFQAIPETSCPSEGQFDKTKRIMSTQCTSLLCLHFETILCEKDWHRVFGPLRFANCTDSDGEGSDYFPLHFCIFFNLQYTPCFN